MNAIHVVATTSRETRAAIERAVRRAQVLETSIVVWIPRPMTPIDDDTSLPALVSEYKNLIASLGGTGRVRVCLCDAVEQFVERLAAL